MTRDKEAFYACLKLGLGSQELMGIVKISRAVRTLVNAGLLTTHEVEGMQIKIADSISDKTRGQLELHPKDNA